MRCLGRTVLLLLVAGMANASGAPAASPACVLTAEDFQALALSPSHIANQAEVDALEGQKIESLGITKQQLLCGTRQALARIFAGKFDKDTYAQISEAVSPFYLSPAERKSFNKLQDAWLNVKLKSMSLQQWESLRRQMLEDARQK